MPLLPTASGRAARTDGGRIRLCTMMRALEAIAKLSFGSVNFSDLVLTFCLVLPDRKRCLKN
jgi:hypothetical protein